MRYIKENFTPLPDRKIQELIESNLDKINESKIKFKMIQEKQANNKSKGREYLEESTKIGREIKAKHGLITENNMLKENTINNNIYSNENHDTNDNFNKSEYNTEYNNFYDKENKLIRKKKKNLFIILKKEQKELIHLKIV